MANKLEIHRISLRFHTRDVEDHFVTNTKNKLADTIRGCSILCFVASLVVSTWYALTLGDDDADKKIVRNTTLSFMGVVCAISAALMSITKIQVCLERTSPLALEAIAVLCLCAFSSGVILIDHFYIARIWALDPYAFASFQLGIWPCLLGGAC